MKTCEVCTLAFSGDRCPNEFRDGRERTVEFHESAGGSVVAHREAMARVELEKDLRNLRA